jgi:AP-4 complex subunit beta-1
MVRGLALRSLCNLRLITILEYVEAPLQKCLKDPSAYVRKTSVMGVLKVRNTAIKKAQFIMFLLDSS